MKEERTPACGPRVKPVGTAQESFKSHMRWPPYFLERGCLCYLLQANVKPAHDELQITQTIKLHLAKRLRM